MHSSWQSRHKRLWSGRSRLDAAQHSSILTCRHVGQGCRGDVIQFAWSSAA